MNSEYLSSQKILDLKREYSESTGELETKRIAKFHCMELIVHDSGYTELQGSLHKAYNSIARTPYKKNCKTENGFNANQFNYTQLRYVVQFLQRILQFDFKNARLRNIEFGVNLEHHLNTELILSNLMRHKGKQFDRSQGIYFNVGHYEFMVKCYFKSRQFGMNENIMRYELHYNTMREINALGIELLFDLLDRSKLMRLLQRLTEVWNEIIMYDYTINEMGLERKYARWIDLYKNPNFWNITIKSNRLNPHKIKLQELVESRSEMIQNKISGMIEENWNGLSDHCPTHRTLIQNV